MSSRLSTAAVIVDYAVADAARAAVDSILSGSSVPTHIIIVDNAQTFANYRTDLLEDSSAQLHVLCPKVNLGFAGGCNLGARRAQDLGVGYIAFVNPDITVDFKGLETVFALLGEPGISAAAGVVQHNGFGGRPFLGGRTHYSPRTGRVWQEHCGVQTPKEYVPYLHGAFFAIRTERYFAVNGMDERYFLYREEVDLCLRIARKFPRSIVMVAPTVAIHAGGVSTGAVGGQLRVGFMSRNYLLLMRGHAGRWTPLWLLSWVLVETLLITKSKGIAAAAHHLRAGSTVGDAGVLLARRWAPAPHQEPEPVLTQLET